MICYQLLWVLREVTFRIREVRGKDGYVVFQIDSSMDLALQVRPEEYNNWIMNCLQKGRCVWYLTLWVFAGISSSNFFVESRSHFKSGLVNQALAAALRAFLLVNSLFRARNILINLPWLQAFLCLEKVAKTNILTISYYIVKTVMPESWVQVFSCLFWHGNICINCIGRE